MVISKCLLRNCRDRVCEYCVYSGHCVPGDVQNHENPLVVIFFIKTLRWLFHEGINIITIIQSSRLRYWIANIETHFQIENVYRLVKVI